MSAELVLSADWSNPERRRVKAVKAAHDFDEAALQELLKTYVLLESRKGARTSPATLRDYASGLRLFLVFCRPDPERSPDVPLLKCSRDDLKRYVYQRQLEVAPESVRLNLACVRALYRALVWAGALTVSPAENVSSPPDPRPRWERRTAVATDDYELLLKVVSERDTTFQVTARNTALLRLLGDAGLRCSEAAALEIADLNMRRKTLYVRSGKGGKAATLPMTGALHAALSAWLELHPKSVGAVLVNLHSRTRKALLHAPMSAEAIRNTLKGIYTEAGLENQAAHALRHTAGVRMYRATKDLHIVSRYLRHSDVSTSAIYAKLDDSELREAAGLLDD